MVGHSGGHPLTQDAAYSREPFRQNLEAALPAREERPLTGQGFLGCGGLADHNIDLKPAQTSNDDTVFLRRHGAACSPWTATEDCKGSGALNRRELH